MGRRYSRTKPKPYIYMSRAEKKKKDRCALEKMMDSSLLEKLLKVEG